MLRCGMTQLHPLDIRVHIESLFYNGMRYLVASIHQDDYAPGMGTEIEKILRFNGYQIVYRQRDVLCMLKDGFIPSTEFVCVRDLI